MSDAPNARSGGVEAAELVGAILQALIALPRPARLKDLETRLGVPAAKLHRYLVSMGRCGLVSREQSGHRYDFGLLAYRIGQIAAHDKSELSYLQPLIQAFVEKLDQPSLGQTVGIGQWLGRGATIVKWFESNAPLSIRMRPGAAMGVTQSATAKLLAAYQPREVTEPLVREELESLGRSSKSAVNAVYAEYAAIRESSIAYSHGARQRNVNALSVPLFNHEGEVFAAVTLLGMAPQFDASPGGEAAALLKQLGDELSALVGGPASLSQDADGDGVA